MDEQSNNDFSSCFKNKHRDKRQEQHLRTPRRHSESEMIAYSSAHVTGRSHQNCSNTQRGNRKSTRYASESSTYETNEHQTNKPAHQHQKNKTCSGDIRNENNLGLAVNTCNAGTDDDDNETWTYIDERSPREQLARQSKHMLVSPHDSLDAPIYTQPNFDKSKPVPETSDAGNGREMKDTPQNHQTCSGDINTSIKTKGKSVARKGTLRSNSTPESSNNKPHLKHLSTTLPANLNRLESYTKSDIKQLSTKSKQRSSNIEDMNSVGSYERTGMKKSARIYCNIHIDKTIRSFCGDHGVLCCRDCMKDSHNKCHHKSLGELGTTTDINVLKQTAGEHVKRMIADMIKTRRDLNIKQETMSKQEEKMMQRVNSNADKMVDKIRKLEIDLMEQVHETFKDKQRLCESHVQKCDSFINTFTMHFQQLGEPRSIKENLLDRIEMFKQLDKTIETDHRKINNVLSASVNAKETCVFEENIDLAEVVSGASKLGDVVFNVVPNESLTSTASSSWEDCESDILSGSCTDDEISVPRVIEHGILSTWTSRDKTKAADIACIKELIDGTFLVCDITNKKIKWFKYEHGDLKLIAPALKFSFKPWHVEHIHDSKYIVTFPSAESYIELHVAENDLVVGKPVSLGGNYPISTKVNNAIVFLDTVNVNFLTTDLEGGNHKETFDSSITRVFSRPNYMLFSPDKNILYVNDPDKGVFGISMKTKEIVFNYTDGLKCPMEIAFGADECLLVINNQTSDVHAISKYDGEFRYILSLANVPELGKPQCICYLPRVNEYLLSFTECYNIIRFKVR